MKKNEKRMLPIDLTEDERAAKSQELVRALSDYDTTEEEKKSTGKVLADRMKELRQEFTKLRREVQTGKTERLVDVWVEPNLQRRCWVVIRADTSEVVEDYPMSEHEIEQARQIDWTSQKNKRAGDGGDAAAG